ncbi:hypothetical protein GFS31_02640 [Leptolyngbya sp. BL0902]|nr:hypothetical protein GFS31_02640 [Leptolyngbya sp. BL0902]
MGATLLNSGNSWRHGGRLEKISRKYLEASLGFWVVADILSRRNGRHPQFDRRTCFRLITQHPLVVYPPLVA